MQPENVERVRQVIKRQREQILTSVLWGAVAAAGQLSMLFLTIIGRIHVRFANETPLFSVDPRGPIHLTKNSALATVWAMTLAYALLVVAVVYFRPRPSKSSWFAVALVTVALAAVAGLAEPWWSLVVLADALALYPLLRAPSPDKEPTRSAGE